MIETTHTRLDSILEREFDLKKNIIHLTGTTSPLSLAFFLANTNARNINILPHMVVCPSLEIAKDTVELIKFFDPKKIVHLLPEFDISPFSGLYPKPTISPNRIGFLRAAQSARPGEVFITTATALSQKTIPYKILSDRILKFKLGDELPEDIHNFFQSLGYVPTPLVEDVGQYSIRGGILDIFSSSENMPVRIELFGHQIETLRHFSPTDQRSQNEIQQFSVTPATEILFLEEQYEKLISRFRKSLDGRELNSTDVEETIRSLLQRKTFPGIEFLLPYFYDSLDLPLDHFSTSLNVYFLDPIEISKFNDDLFSELKSDFKFAEKHVIRPEINSLFESFDNIQFPDDSRLIYFSSLEFLDGQKENVEIVPYRTHRIFELYNFSQGHPVGSDPWIESFKKKFSFWSSEGYRFILTCKIQSQIERLKLLVEKIGLNPIVPDKDYQWDSYFLQQDKNSKYIHLIQRGLSESIRIEEEKIIFLREEDFFGKKEKASKRSSQEDFNKQAKRLNFGDLKPGDLVAHIKHGIGVYEGLKIMPIGGVESEFIQVAYKDKDKLYLPVYRVGQLQKFSGAATTLLDKLGGTGWEKTKIKVKNHLRDIAAELLSLYAKRSEVHRPSFAFNDNDIDLFEKKFPYEETDDQLRAISDIFKDLKSDKPMDRLICGDVGFGKTEVAMRAAFFGVQNQKQVAVLAPTTVLAFQHFETFKTRFEGWPINIQVLNRFVSNTDAKKILNECKEGKVDILIGTHRILSKDVSFKNLGMMIVDEEQKFGVLHKEKIKKLKVDVDSLTLSATPIPRTLNMSLTGVRDLSLINSAPVDRLPTRTFICKFDTELIEKAINTEMSRGGQVYFIHNRIQSIYALADEIMQIVPKARIKVAHGQMDEDELEKTMLQFFHHEIDVLVCTAIVESGMDVSRANTMFIDSAHMFGLSQLYQLRGRVGRSKTRAYCYLMLPRDRKIEKDAQERLKIIQENSALGSGIRIAQYDLEMRGSGNILGDEQSGHVNAVGYEIYMDLLAEALAEAKGESIEDFELDPEINLRIPAMIPDAYISDIRIRLSYYKALADISSESELEQIEEELKDQFGPIPEPTLNLMGLMLIRRQCKELGVRDVGAGVKSISLIFTEKTKIKTETVIQLAMRENKKYSVTPDNRLNIRINNITWGNVYEELNYLLKLI